MKKTATILIMIFHFAWLTGGNSNASHINSNIYTVIPGKSIPYKWQAGKIRQDGKRIGQQKRLTGNI